MPSDDLPLFLAVDFQLSVLATPWHDPEFYVQEITGTLKAITSDTEEPLGTIQLLLAHATQALNNRIHLADVCDAHSDYMVSVYNALFDETGETKPELDIEPAWNDILVLLEFDVPDEFRSTGCVVRAFETAITTFASADLIVAAMEGKLHDFDGLDLTVDEWRQLGFKRIAGSQFAFRETCRINPYGIDDIEQD